MAFCTQCGTQLTDSTPVCPTCGAPNEGYTPAPAPSYSSSPELPNSPVRENLYSAAGSVASAAQGVASSARAATDNFRQNQQAAAAQRERTRHMVLAEGEQIVKSYHCSTLFKLIPPRWSNGYLTVTNKRLVLEGRGGASRVTQETRLEDIANIDAYYGLDIHFLQFLIGVLLLVSGFSMFPLGLVGVLAGLLVWAIAAVVIFFAFRKCFKIKIYAYANKHLTNVLSIGELSLRSLKSGALHSITGRPAEDTDTMINELGALVLDLQTLGDRAISKWR